MDANDRRESDRRRTTRGGRRSPDQPGFAPLVFVIDADLRRRDISEVILAQLRLAVAPFDSVAEAMLRLYAFRPAVIVAGRREADELVRQTRADRPPIVTVPDKTEPLIAIVEAVRTALRRRTG